MAELKFVMQSCINVRMAEHYYSDAEQRRHLEALAVVLDDAASAIFRTPQARFPAYDLQLGAIRARELLARDFTRSDIHELLQLFPNPMLRSYPGLELPSVQTASGQWKLADWYEALEPLIAAVDEAAMLVRSVGYCE